MTKSTGLTLQGTHGDDSSRLAALVLLGSLRAVENGAWTAEGTEWRLWLPYVADQMRKAGVREEVVEVVDACGIEMDTMERVWPELLLETARKLQQQLLDVLKELGAPGRDGNYWISPDE